MGIDNALFCVATKDNICITFVILTPSKIN